MSAMKVLDEIREKGGNIILFESFCGGLVAPRKRQQSMELQIHLES